MIESRTESAKLARQLVAALDLTSLGENDDAATIRDLCRRARTPAGPVAAVCVWPRFVPQARAALSGSGIKVCTVANFPDGGADSTAAAEEVRAAVAAGAEEIDVVFPFAAFQRGDRAAGTSLLGACRTAAGAATLKAILETGALDGAAAVEEASADAIAAGADFLKTSTGKRVPGAAPEAAAAMLRAIAGSGRTVGFKAAGGIRTYAEAVAYLDLARRILGPAAIRPDRFRIGASTLLDDLLARIEGG